MTPALAPADPCSVSLSVCRLDDDRDLPRQKALGLLSPDEHARAQRFCFEKDFNRFVRARGHLRLALAEATGMHPAEIKLQYGPHGKPRMLPLPGQPCPHFNLSHSAGLAVLAVSWDVPVGLDLELIDRNLDPVRLAPSVFAPVECQMLEAVATADALPLFLAMWTAKEAWIKLTGEGMSCDLRSITLELQGGWPTGYLSADGQQVLLEYPDIGHPGAICAVARQAGPVLREHALRGPVLRVGP